MDKTEFLQNQLDLLKRKSTDDSIEWQDITDFRNAELGLNEHRDTIRKGYKLLQEYIDAGWDIKKPGAPDKETYALRKERIKFQTEKLEFNRNLRELARDELVIEHIENAIASLPPIEIPDPIVVDKSEKEYLLCLSDAHFGTEFEIKGLDGEVINAYSPEVFKERMIKLMSKLIDVIEKEDIYELNIFELGDGIDGLLRLSSNLMRLKYGVIESSILYAEYLANWLNVLSKYVVIRFQMVADSNHNQLRLCGAPKNAFPEENMSKVIEAFLKERLKDNPNIEFICNPTGMNFVNLAGYNILGIHGEVKKLSTAINDISRAYNTHIDYVIAGHKHHAEANEVGINAETIHVRSIIGVDPYGLSLNAVSNPGVSMFVFEENNGKVCEYTFKL